MVYLPHENKDNESTRNMLTSKKRPGMKFFGLRNIIRYAIQDYIP